MRSHIATDRRVAGRRCRRVEHGDRTAGVSA